MKDQRNDLKGLKKDLKINLKGLKRDLNKQIQDNSLEQGLRKGSTR